jgi:hypothetical protein
LIGALLLPLIFSGPVWAWRRVTGRALGLSRAEARWWRALAEYCIGYVLATATFMILENQTATRRCFLLVDSRCDLPFGEMLGEMVFVFLFAAGPLGVPALLYAGWEIQRRIRAAPVNGLN